MCLKARCNHTPLEVLGPSSTKPFSNISCRSSPGRKYTAFILFYLYCYHMSHELQDRWWSWKPVNLSITIVCKSQGKLTRWRSNKYATQSTGRRFDRYELKYSRCLLATISILRYDNGARPVRFLSACTTGQVTSSCAVITYARRFQQIYAYYSRSSRPMFIKTLENPLWVQIIVIFPSVLSLLSFQSAVTFGQLKNHRGRIVLLVDMG